MLNRRHFVAAATALAALVPAVAQAQQVGTPVTVEEPTPTGNAQGVSDDPNEMIRWMAFEGATVVTLPATRDVLIRELTGAIDLGYFTHNQRTYPRGSGLETIHSYRITPRGRAVGHKLNLGGEAGDHFMTTVGEKLALTPENEDGTFLNLAARGEMRPRAGAGREVVWEFTPYGQMLMQAGRQ